jgi:uncharacterized protein (DUF2147 family)
MKNLLLLSLIVVTLQSFTQQCDEILGVWANDSGKGHIQIYKQEGKYYGKIIWLKQPTDETGKPKIDKKNPDKNLQARPLMGMVMLRDFQFEGEEWTGGKIYNPSDGKEYKCYMKLKDPKTLSIRGYIGFSLLGKTENFQRVR